MARASEVAKKVRLNSLVGRIRAGETLSAAETKEVETLEQEVTPVDLIPSTSQHMSDVARWMGVTLPAVRYWYKTSDPPRTLKYSSTYEYNREAITHWFVAKHSLRRPGVNADQGDDQIKRAIGKEKHRMMRLKRMREEGTLVKRGQVISEVRELLVGLRTRLMRAPMDACEDCRSKVEREIRDGLLSVGAFLREIAFARTDMKADEPPIRCEDCPLLSEGGES